MESEEREFFEESHAGVVNNSVLIPIALIMIDLKASEDQLARVAELCAKLTDISFRAGREYERT